MEAPPEREKKDSPSPNRGETFTRFCKGRMPGNKLPSRSPFRLVNRVDYVVKSLKLTVLVEDSANPSRLDLVAKHGLSILAEVDRKEVSFLMDTGPSPDALLHNADAMGIDLSKIDLLFLSHGHYDHTGGLVGLLKRIGKKIPVVAHPKVFDVKLKIEPSLKYIGSPFKLSEAEVSGGVILTARNPVTIMEEVTTSGEIKRNTPYEKVKGFWTIDEENFKADIMPDDQALIFNIKEKGLVILCGCAHAGIINTIRQAQKVTDTDKIYAVIGGFHLTKASDERIKLTIKELLRLGPEVIAPCHCTGSRAVRRLTEAFGDRCRPLRTGDIIQL